MKDTQTKMTTRRQWLRMTMASAGSIGMHVLASGEPCIGTVRTGEGPFYPQEDIPIQMDLTRNQQGEGLAQGWAIYLLGEVTDTECKPISRARVEVWQADHLGHYNHARAGNQDRLDANFHYFAAVNSNATGHYLFKTIRPADYSVGGLRRAPHIHIKVSAPGYQGLTTEMYFKGDEPLQEKDPVFMGRHAARREELVMAAKPATTFADWGFALEAGIACFHMPLRLESRGQKSS